MEIQQVVEAPRIATPLPLGSKDPFTDDDLGVEHPPPTARTLAPFKKIRPGMTLQDAVRLCGLPDGRYLSGGYHLIYHLRDGSVIKIFAKDPLSRVAIVQQGTRSLLVDPEALGETP